MTQSNRGADDPGDNTLSEPQYVAKYGDMLFVSDRGNHRVVIWEQFPEENGELTVFFWKLFPYNNSMVTAIRHKQHISILRDILRFT